MQDLGAKPPEPMRVVIPRGTAAHDGNSLAARRRRPPMTMTVEHLDRLRICLSGEFDLSQIDAFAVAVDELYDTEIELDLSDLDFIDSSGIRALIQLHRRVESDGGRLSIELGASPIARTLQLSGVTRILSFVDVAAAGDSDASSEGKLAR